MLERLSIKNFALIDSAEIEFSNGFTVLSGETGAGKSILIGAISFVLGGKAGIEQIRNGAGEATVSAVFSINPEGQKQTEKNADEQQEARTALQWLEQHGIEIEDNTVLLRRFIRENGRGGAWIQNTPVTRSELAAFSSFLIDIHGQHEHQSLMRVAEHRVFLDSWAGLTEEVQSFTADYTKLAANRRRLAELASSQSGLEQKIEMLTFAVNEIEEAKLKNKEDELLEEEEAKLSSFEKLYASIENLMEILSSSGEGGVVSLMKKAQNELTHVSGFDRNLEPLLHRFENSFYEVSDIFEEVRNYSRSLVFDPERLSEIQERLALIYKLKKKYASSVNAPLSEVFDYFENAQHYIEENGEGNNYKEKLEVEIKNLEKELLISAESLSKKRKETAIILNTEVNEILSKLGMKGTRFEVSIKQKSGTDLQQNCGPYGKDDIEFMISANPGNPLLPLAKIASGGELSRVMLALKTIFAQTDSVDTLIFDEIDTGIGGEVAVAVGLHLKNLAKKRQIFCITHLASIAVYADNQIKIEKTVSGEITSSNVHVIEGEERVSEIARMLSGDSDTQQSLEHARLLLSKYSKI